jgi:hypothetical protein
MYRDLELKIVKDSPFVGQFGYLVLHHNSREDYYPIYKYKDPKSSWNNGTAIISNYIYMRLI